MRIRDFGAIAIKAGLVLALALPPVAFAQEGRDRDRSQHNDRDRDHGRDDNRGNDRDRRDHRDDRNNGNWNQGRPGSQSYRGAPPPGWYDHGRRQARHWNAPPARTRVYRDVVIARPYGAYYNGYGSYRRDNDAFKWLGLTAITLTILSALSENQQRTLEDAQIRATSSPIGQPVIWSNGRASGNVVAIREGRSADGTYCREFQQNVVIAGRSEEAYGTACRQSNGAWQVID